MLWEGIPVSASTVILANLGNSYSLSKSGNQVTATTKTQKRHQN
ncbi:MAG: hypothetical protein ACLT5B_06620 [Clostridia bacterium]